ncbi:MAG: glycosyltransferase, partial [Myxococcaceae bacterium]|nr:glycosyltransferase [Myxococcaceae bacterium]
LLGKLRDVPGARLLLITGRLAVDKRPQLLVDAALRLAQDFPVALVVLGDGPERERLEQRAAGLPQATFLPFLHDRAEYAAMLASVDLLLHGSVCETFGFVLAETLLSGTPVVVPNAGAAPHMVSDGCAMVYERTAGPEQIARAAAQLLRRERGRVQASALATAARHPTMEQHFEQLFSLYGELLRQKSTRVVSSRARIPAASALSNA